MEIAENEEYKTEAQRICMSVVNNTETWPEQQSQYNPNSNLLSVAPYSHYYQPQQYFSHFTPYYYNLITAPVNYNYNYNNSRYSYPSIMATKTDIEKYINYELNRQQSLMVAKQQQNPPARPALAPLQLQKPIERKMAPQEKPIERKMPPRKAPQEKRILNVQVVAMATNPRDKTPAVEPLPPVEDSFRERVAKIDKSQQHYTHLFGRLTCMLQTLNRRYDGHEPEPEPEEEYEDAPAPPSKRPRHESCSSSESQLDVETALTHYPQRIKLEDGSAAYVLGPNGTQISAQQYGQIFGQMHQWQHVASSPLYSAVMSWRLTH